METGARFPKGKKPLELVTYARIPLPPLICPKSKDCPQGNPQPEANENGCKVVAKNQIYTG